jgi:short-subunit dehydrogenase
MKAFQGKRAIVTGASSGIGEQLAIQLGAAGAHVALVARRAERLEQVAIRCRKYDVRATVVVADLSIPEDCARAIREANEALDGVDLLILNAGIDIKARVDEIKDLEIVNTIMKTNYLGPVHCTVPQHGSPR